MPNGIPWNKEFPSREIESVASLGGYGSTITTGAVTIPDGLVACCIEAYAEDVVVTSATGNCANLSGKTIKGGHAILGEWTAITLASEALVYFKRKT